jgi:hypothetical protein
MKKCYLSVVPAMSVLAFFTIMANQTFAASLVTEKTVPLYRYQTNTGLDAFVASPDEIASYDKLAKQADDPKNGFIFFRRLMMVGHVYLSKQPQTLPLLTLFRDTNLGRSFFYTTDIDEAVILQKNGWEMGLHNKGITCYVATKPQPGTIPVYRLQQPNGINVLYAFGEQERSKLAKLNVEKIAFYVWAKPVTDEPVAKKTPKAAKPDLSIGDIKEVADKSITFVINHHGGDEAIATNTVNVQLTARNAQGKIVWIEQQPVAQELAPDSGNKITLNTEHSMTGVKVSLLVDALNKVAESDEQNNMSGAVDGPVFLVKGVIQPTTKIPLSLVDFNLRSALYANGAVKQKVNTAAQYATPDKPITLKKSEAIDCQGDFCTFNLGFIVIRNSSEGNASTYALIRRGTTDVAGNTVSFPAGAKTSDLVLPCKLRLGENILTIEVDPYKKTAETNENNNSFVVKIIVEQ